MTTKIYNLIILDESGSMHPYLRQTISGCNETIQSIGSCQKEFADTQEHYISVFSFNSSYMHYIIKNMHATETFEITPEQYSPGYATPLYDAIGMTLNELKALTKSEKSAIANVTIITDGYENSSTKYSRQEIARMIDALKEQGWSFNFIGANIDVEAEASMLNIDNRIAFEQSDEGMRCMFEKERKSRRAYFERLYDTMPNGEISKEERIARYKQASKGYFDEDDNK